MNIEALQDGKRLLRGHGRITSENKERHDRKAFYSVICTLVYHVLIVQLVCIDSPHCRHQKSVMDIDVYSFESVALLAQSFGLSLMDDVVIEICTLLLNAFIIKDLHELHHCQINQPSQCHLSHY